MSLVVHHLQRSQSERVVWLLEELNLPYEIKLYRRDSKTALGPPELKAVHPSGVAPILEDGNLKLGESSAIMEYLLARHAPDSALVVPPSAHNYVDYVFWFQWGAATLQDAVMRPSYLAMAGVAPDHPIMQRMKERLRNALVMLDDRLRTTGKWLAGDQFTAADIYCAVSVTTMRLFSPFEIEGLDGIRTWAGHLAKRPAYKRFIEKAEKAEERGVFPVLCPEAPQPFPKA
ncbi:putative glutathione S-transferase [Auricularia subglabra TFB-10046 SS5]|nr:putative glutathione S-transferase [Auricularia subglabra TFB-10046 SS5]